MVEYTEWVDPFFLYFSFAEQEIQNKQKHFHCFQTYQQIKCDQNHLEWEKSYTHGNIDNVFIIFLLKCLKGCSSKV